MPNPSTHLSGKATPQPAPIHTGDRKNLVSAEELAQWLGQAFPPTEQQAAVITAPAEPLLVVAGAGAGKTETMAARVVWLVANRFVAPDAVLGLTFTRKAAQELGMRIRHRLSALAQAPELRSIDPDGSLARNLSLANPTVLTYDSYAGRLVREYGLLLPVEPTARLIGDTELYLIARDVISSMRGDLHLSDSYGLNNMVEQVLQLNTELDNHLVGTSIVQEETEAFLQEMHNLPPSKRVKHPQGLTKDTEKAIDAQQRRLVLLPAVNALREELRRRNVMTFTEQMSVAARLVVSRPEVRRSQTQRFRAVMLDEYQDTSASQRILLSHLFGTPETSSATDGNTPDNTGESTTSAHLSDSADGIAVTAVGDPMQAIYSWRGATASNLIEFTKDFPRSIPAPDDTGDADSAPHMLVEAETRELTTSWRNPADVLELANEATIGQLGALDNPRRIVSALTPRDGAPAGEVHLGRYRTAVEEIDAVADMLAEDFHNHRATNTPYTGAVLVRKNAQTTAMAQALADRDIPFEIVGLKGLLDVAEVADVLAFARMLIHPPDDAAALRVLLGPTTNLGLSDLAALGQRARNLSGRAGRKQRHPQQRTAGVGESTEADVSAGAGTAGLQLDAPDMAAHITALLQARQRESVLRAEGTGAELDAEQGLVELERTRPAIETFAAEIAELLDDSSDAHAGLTDALADLGEPERYSEEGYRRLSVVASQLRELRQNSLGGSLPDIIADIEQVCGVRGEVLARENPASRVRVGTAHLDKLQEEVANYARIPGASLSSMLDFFQLAKTRDFGLERGEVSVSGDRVQLLTVHKAKGLEWSTVAVIGATDSTYGVRGVSTWVTTPGLMPTTLRSDAEGSVAHRFGAPVLDTSDVETQAQLSSAVEAFKAEVRANDLGEVERLFYVALTRAEHRLIVTCAADNGGSKPQAPFHVLEQLMKNHPEFTTDTTGEIVPAASTDASEASSLEASSPAASHLAAVDELQGQEPAVDAAWLWNTPEDAAPFPRDFLGERAVSVHRAADRVRQEYARLQSGEEPESQPTLWAREVQALIDEAHREATPTITVPLSQELTASDVISLRKDPVDFAKRRRRPRPFKPNSYAKRGTALHQWIEEHYGGGSLIDEDELPGMGEENITPSELELLKEKFLASSWADLQPVLVEYPFTVSLGDKLVTGRIDAIFHHGDDLASGWQVVDWKSGVPPRGKELQDAAIQLAVYRYALAQLLSSAASTPPGSPSAGGRLAEAIAQMPVAQAQDLSRLADVDVHGIDAGFYYIGFEQFVVPGKLPTVDELADLMGAGE